MNNSLKELDKILENIINFKVPAEGWINFIKKSLGIPNLLLIRKLGVAPNYLIRAEESEQNKKIQLNSLEKVFDAMECELVYFPKPKNFPSFLALIEHKALDKAKKNFDEEVSKMNIEIKDESQKTLVLDMIKQKYLNESLKKLWE
ncbi:MAG: hypothetical protein J0H68_09230 [Sphingobacteriia bacterium]|nr:hypothetical protein [Sphingobacteriia bacterium]